MVGGYHPVFGLILTRLPCFWPFAKKVSFVRGDPDDTFFSNLCKESRNESNGLVFASCSWFWIPGVGTDWLAERGFVKKVSQATACQIDTFFANLLDRVLPEPPPVEGCRRGGVRASGSPGSSCCPARYGAGQIAGRPQDSHKAPSRLPQGSLKTSSRLPQDFHMRLRSVPDGDEWGTYGGRQEGGR